MVRLFSVKLRVVWMLLVAAMIVVEVVPRPLWWSPLPYYSYQISKLLGFLIVGYLTPLSFWSFSSLGRGVSFGLLSTAAIETIQGLIEGHRFSFLEMFVKLTLLMAGFGLALLARYDKHIHIGPLYIDLNDEHWRS
jgi:hypothetical protein